MYPETLPLSLKVATLAPDNAGFSSILIPALFLRKKERVEKVGKLANDVVKKGKWNETYRQ